MWQYICDHNSEKTRWIFIIFALIYAGRTFLDTHEKHVHLTDLNNTLTLPCENETYTHTYTKMNLSTVKWAH